MARKDSEFSRAKDDRSVVAYLFGHPLSSDWVAYCFTELSFLEK